MSILGGGNDNSPDSPEDIVEHEEQSIVEDMESRQLDIEEAIDSEERLYQGIEQGLPEN